MVAAQRTARIFGLKVHLLCAVLENPAATAAGKSKSFIDLGVHFLKAFRIPDNPRLAFASSKNSRRSLKYLCNNIACSMCKYSKIYLHMYNKCVTNVYLEIVLRSLLSAPLRDNTTDHVIICFLVSLLMERTYSLLTVSTLSLMCFRKIIN